MRPLVGCILKDDEEEAGDGKVVEVKKKPKKLPRASYPTAIKMAIRAKTAEQKEAGDNRPGLVSRTFIGKYILENYTIPNVARHKTSLKTGLNRCIETGKIVQVRHSFRLVDKRGRRYIKEGKGLVTARKTLPGEKKVVAVKHMKEDEEEDAKEDAEEEKESTSAGKRKKAKAKAFKSPTRKRKAATKKKKAEDAAEEAPEDAAEDAAEDAEEPPRKKKKPSLGGRKKKAPSRGSAGTGTPTVESTDGEGHWHYEDRGWHRYDDDASELIENAYQDYLKDPGSSDVRAVRSGHWTYQVDFRNMQQTNIDHPAHTVRNIKRF
eukprot:TRINITY_DN6301_c1_g1_i2.p1 TRINITY_DN6301_c1_g1~~TRINITY_DN6301_c1_g1_i2.p1  ORF type:complete len:321 (-),score=97.33 TRINITY_DN6301_c1_g1_i2:991-1953(-)